MKKIASLAASKKNRTLHFHPIAITRQQRVLIDKVVNINKLSDINVRIRTAEFCDRGGCYSMVIDCSCASVGLFFPRREPAKR